MKISTEDFTDVALASKDNDHDDQDNHDDHDDHDKKVKMSDGVW